MDADRAILAWLSARFPERLPMRASVRGRESADGFRTDAGAGVEPVHGVSLASFSVRDMKAAGMPDALAGKLARFCGLRGARAAEELRKAPLVLSPSEASAVLDAWRLHFMRTAAAPAWSRLSGRTGIPWAELHWKAQAGWTGACMKLGLACAQAVPALGVCIRRGDLNGAGAALKAGQLQWGAGWRAAYECGWALQQAAAAGGRAS